MSEIRFFVTLYFAGDNDGRHGSSHSAEQIQEIAESLADAIENHAGTPVDVNCVYVEEQFSGAKAIVHPIKTDILPTCLHYSYLLSRAIRKFKITRGEARNKYGQFTYGQWQELLNT